LEEGDSGAPPRRAGPGPLLLLIPGMLNTVDIWKPVLPFLRGAEVRIADVQTQSSMADMAADAWRLVDSSPAPVVLCGYSMGGYVAIELLARLSPEQRARVAGALFLDTSAVTETPDTLRMLEKTIAGFERDFAQAVERMIPFSLHPDSRADADLVEGMRRMLHAVGPATAIRQVRALMVRADRRAMLAGLDMPVLIACGREDRVAPPDLSRDFAALVPGARLEWLERSGHQTTLEQPREVAGLILSLLPK